MTLFKSLLISVLGFVAVANAEYRLHPGPYQPPYQPVPYEPDPYQPDPYQPGNPHERPDQILHREAYIGRVVRAETLHLMELLGLGRGARGLRVESVEVTLRRGRNNAQLQLMMDRQIQDERVIYNESQVLLTPRWSQELGQGITALQLRVNGEVYIERVVVQLSQDSWNQPNPPGYGREIAVDLPLPGYIPPGSRLDLTRSIDTYRYRGYTVMGLEVTAASRYNAALLEVLFNGFIDGSLTLNPRLSTQMVRSQQRLVVGQNLGSLVLAPRGEVQVTRVRLILRR